MQLFDLDTKITDRSYKILDKYILKQKQMDSSRVNEIRAKCRSILEANGIFPDKKNNVIYQSMETELKKFSNNIDYFNENNLEDITKNRIDNEIDNISTKIDCLENNTIFSYNKDEFKLNKAYNEKQIKNMIFGYFEDYKANTIDLLLKNGYSQNTIDNIEEGILEYSTSKQSDVLTEKFTQDGIKNIELLNNDLTNLSNIILNEAEARYNCKLEGIVYDELKEIRDVVRNKAKKIEELMCQINSIDSKINNIR